MLHVTNTETNVNRTVTFDFGQDDGLDVERSRPPRLAPRRAVAPRSTAFDHFGAELPGAQILFEFARGERLAIEKSLGFLAALAEQEFRAARDQSTAGKP